MFSEERVEVIQNTKKGFYFFIVGMEALAEDRGDRGLAHLSPGLEPCAASSMA